MELNRVYVEWLSSIALDRSRVIRFPSLIFLCGGAISPDLESCHSCRDVFHRHLKENGFSLADRVILAEEIFRYFDHSIYQDLLRFERDLAELSLLTVVFSESPGSIAEMGSFAVLKTIQTRLLVVLHESDSNRESFIWRGPASYLKSLAKESERPDPIHIYSWRRDVTPENPMTATDFADAEDLQEAIETLVKAEPGSQAFSADKPGHRMLLLVELLRGVRLATLDELLAFLVHLCVPYERRSVEQHLSLLVTLKFVSVKPYRNNKYYLAGPQAPWLKWAFKEGVTNRDVDRWQSLFAEHYVTEEQQKTRALRSYLKDTVSTEV